MNRLSAVFILMVLLVSVDGCGGGSAPPSLASITIAPSSPSTAECTTQQFTATAKDASGIAIGGVTFTWVSSSTGVATIDSSGLATGVSAGTTQITAAANGVKSPVATLTVTAPTTTGFELTGNMTTARWGHTATLLNNGTVLIAGGWDGGALVSAELYDPMSGTFMPTGNMDSARYLHTATLMNNGQVLIAGGEVPCDPYGLCATAGATLYDPPSGTFIPAASMATGRAFHTATMLKNGKVLVAGGLAPDEVDPYITVWASAELYDPSTGTFTPTGNMNDAREEHTATLTNDGLVVVTGGSDNDRFGSGENAVTSAELYDPTTGKFTYTGNLNTARVAHTATLLNDGQVLIAGGYTVKTFQSLLGSAELYNSVTGAFKNTGSMCMAREYHQASLVEDGAVLVTGGSGDVVNRSGISIAELYDPSSGLFTYPMSMLIPTYSHTSTPLNNGNVLLAGGNDGSPRSELYAAGTSSPKGLVSITVTPATPTLSVGGTLQFIATGTFSDNNTQVLQSVIWSSSDQTVVTVSNDASNHGIAFAVGAGTSLITATAGSIAGSTFLTVE